MKTRQDFEMIIDDFYNTTNGKMEKAFIDSIIDFMDKHNFQMKIINTIYEDENFSVLFLTDNIFNDYGIFFVEASTSFTFVGEKKQVKQNILAYLTK